MSNERIRLGGWEFGDRLSAEKDPVKSQKLDLENPPRSSLCIDVTALVPQYESKQIWGSTFEDYPTFWFYVKRVGKPDDQKYLYELTFKLNSDNQPKIIEIPLNNQPKIIQISLDGQGDESLNIGKIYRWELEISCYLTDKFLAVEDTKGEKKGSSNPVYGHISKAENDDNPNVASYDILNDSIEKFCATSNPTWISLENLLEIISLENLMKEALQEDACEKVLVNKKRFLKHSGQNPLPSKT